VTVYNAAISTDNDDGFDDGTTWRVQFNNYGGSGIFTIRDNPLNLYQGGVRFQGVTVPNGATINDAYVTLTASSNLSGFTSLQAYGDNVDSAAAWSASSRPGSGFTDTTGGTAQTSLPASGTFTVDITACVQDIVDRAGWSSGNDMRFRLFPVASYSTGNIADLDAGHSNEAVIYIDYTAAGGSANPWYYYAQQ